MSRIGERTEPKEIQKARDSFKMWRKTRVGKGRIPERLWDLAINLGVEYGVSHTSRELGLSYRDLKKRIRARHGDLELKRRLPFVELPVSEGIVSNGGIPECILELEDAGGMRLKVELRGGVIPDVSELAKIFCGRR